MLWISPECHRQAKTTIDLIDVYVFIYQWFSTSMFSVSFLSFFHRFLYSSSSSAPSSTRSVRSSRSSIITFEFCTSTLFFYAATIIHNRWKKTFLTTKMLDRQERKNRGSFLIPYFSTPLEDSTLTDCRKITTNTKDARIPVLRIRFHWWTAEEQTIVRAANKF